MIAIPKVKTWLCPTLCFAQRQDFDMNSPLSTFHFPLSTSGVPHGA
jgi:hypothetical protein